MCSAGSQRPHQQSGITVQGIQPEQLGKMGRRLDTELPLQVGAKVAIHPQRRRIIIFGEVAAHEQALGALAQLIDDGYRPSRSALSFYGPEWPASTRLSMPFWAQNGCGAAPSTRQNAQ
jgi:hypothetical protein